MILPLFYAAVSNGLAILESIFSILDENAVPRGGVVDHHVGDRADELAVLYQEAVAQVRGG